MDLFLVLDSSSKDRLGEAQAVFDTAKQTACVDHHVSNLGYAKDNFVKPGCSSACEVLYGLMEEELIDEKIAEALSVWNHYGYRCVPLFQHHPKNNGDCRKSDGKGHSDSRKYIDECFLPENLYTDTSFLEEHFLQACV